MKCSTCSADVAAQLEQRPGAISFAIDVDKRGDGKREVCAACWRAELAGTTKQPARAIAPIQQPRGRAAAGSTKGRR